MSYFDENEVEYVERRTLALEPGTAYRTMMRIQRSKFFGIPDMLLISQDDGTSDCEEFDTINIPVADLKAMLAELEVLH